MKVRHLKFSILQGLFRRGFFSVCTSPWTCFIPRPSLLFSNFNLVRAILSFTMTVFWINRLSLALNPVVGDDIFFEIITCL